MSLIRYSGYETERELAPRPKWDAAVSARAALRKADRSARITREESRIAAHVEAALRLTKTTDELRRECLAGAPLFNPALTENIAEALMRRGRTWAEVVSHGPGCALISRARFEVAYILVSAGFSKGRVGKWLGGRCSQTILNGVRRHQERIDAGEIRP